jgi:hypothetical protein
LRDFKFAICHHKAKKKSDTFRNLDLDNTLKIIAAREYDLLSSESKRFSSMPAFKANYTSKTVKNAINQKKNIKQEMRNDDLHSELIQ